MSYTSAQWAIAAPCSARRRYGQPRALKVIRVAVPVMLCAAARSGFAQTFAQITELGPEHGIGPRITRTVARNKLQGASLFGSIGGKVTWIDASVSPATAYEFSTDAFWDRIVFGQKDVWIDAETNAEQGLQLSGPRGLDVTTMASLFVADALNGRIAVFGFHSPGRLLIFQGEVRDDQNLGVPVDVAWDGGLDPHDAAAPYFYVLDVLGRLSYWRWFAPSFTLQWVYGAGGSGTGQFLRPSGVCVGRTLAANGGVRFTEDVYVADTGNRRLVWLRRGAAGPTWMRAMPLEQDGEPSDCTVDQFGNVIVADRKNNRLLKFTADLSDELDLYGSYGRGATNYNTFSHPVSVHVPYGQRVSNGTAVYYGEGRIITAEDWTDSSGALEHWLGVRIPVTILWGGGPWGQGVTYRITDHAYVSIELMRGDASAGFLDDGTGSFKPAGWVSFFWDGTYGGNGGPPAAAGYYRFRIAARNAYGWVSPVILTNEFYFGPCDPGDRHCYQSRNVGLPLDGSITIGGPPTTFFLKQVVSPYVGPVVRRSAVSASIVGDAEADLAGRLSAEVRARGLTALSIGVPSGSSVPVVVRIYALNGTLVRELVRQSLEPGDYVVGWDGRDRTGRPTLPGIYVAVMNAGGFRAVRRLIVPRN